MKQFASAICAIALIACGDDASTMEPDARPDDEPDAAESCSSLELGPSEFQFNVFGQLTGVRYPIIAGDLQNAQLVIELYDESTGGLPKLATGTFDLAAAPNTNLATCQHCVYVAWKRADETLELQYFQAEGQMALTKVTDPLESVFAGSVTAKLRAATADVTGTSTFAVKGACIGIENLVFDTTPVDAPCAVVEDCPNELMQVCDPRTQRCVAPQCIDFGGCSDTQTCLPQREQESFGACYEDCDPSRANSCGAGFTCWQSTPRTNEGYCVVEGTGALGTACKVGDVTSSCTGDLMCSRESKTCAAHCNLFDDVPGCSADTRCSIFGLCEPSYIADPAALGEQCRANAYQAAPCAADAVGFQGYCFSYTEDSPKVCIEACLDDGDCAEEQFCSPRFTSGLGTCLPDPVCGDGQLGEVGEACDDGNTEDGDTCSADCQRVDYAASCAKARTIEEGMTYTGDTVEGLDGFQSTCQLGRSRTALYEFAPGVPGKLTVTIDSEAINSVAVLDTCDAAPMENVCRVTASFLPNTVTAQLRSADPVTISVAGYTVIDEGPHAISVDFTPEDCGDGVIAGREICDDGNEVSNDGCSGDCRTIEYDAVCANAMPLVLGGAGNTGTTADGQYFFENSCSGGGITGRDRVYKYTAPAAGTLHLSLDQGINDLTLVVFKGCGEPSALEELACSSVYGPEEANVQLAAGDTVTIVVDGFGHDDAGPYTLTASFQ
jgi:cysteine-rich repeat protein